MGKYDHVVVQYEHADVATILSVGADLLITEGRPLEPDAIANGVPILTDAEVGQLVAAGTDVVGYVNVAVTDDTRPYWQAAWTFGGKDTDPVDVSVAPDWLDTGKAIDFDGKLGTDAYIVDFRKSSWQDIVIAQAVDLVERGYSGVFLDDIGRYFDYGTNVQSRQSLAREMVDLVIRIREAIGPDAKIITNGSVYLGTDAGGGSKLSDLLSAIDMMVIESQFRNEPLSKAMENIEFAIQHYASGAQISILEFVGQFGTSNVTREQLFEYHRYSDGLGLVSSFSGTDVYANPGIEQGTATAGADVLFGNGANNTLSGLGGADRIAGFAGDDSLSGEGGDDLLVGGAGRDRLFGGIGRDMLYGGTGNDTLQGGAGADLLDGGADRDTASYVDASAAVIASLAKTTINTGDAAGDTYISIENLAGSTFADRLYGDGAINVLSGNGGDDLLHGGAGADQLHGGAGVDGAAYWEAATGIIASLADPTINTGDAAGDMYSSIENLYGSRFGDRLHGAVDANALVGNDGDDLLHGGAGADQLYGGNGSDGAAYWFAASGVNASLISPATNTGDAAGDSYASIENLYGSAFADQLRGDNAANALVGNDGGDTLYGFGGADNLYGGNGADHLVGGTQADRLWGGADADTFYGVNDNGIDRIEDWQDGIDRINLRSVSGINSFAQLSVTNGVGGAFITWDGGTSGFLVVGQNASVIGASDFVF